MTRFIYKTGNLLDEKVDALVNPVNCCGAMGKGLALQFKKKFPANFSVYKEECMEGKVKIGKMLTFMTNHTNPQYIINFPTKIDWHFPSRLNYIVDGMVNLRTVVKDLGIQSIAIPALGCGLGQLPWSVIKEIIEGCLKELKLSAIIYEPREKQ